MERQDRHDDVARSRIAEAATQEIEGRLESYLSSDGNSLPRAIYLILYCGYGGQAIRRRCRALHRRMCSAASPIFGQLCTQIRG